MVGARLFISESIFLTRARVRMNLDKQTTQFRTKKGFREKIFFLRGTDSFNFFTRNLMISRTMFFLDDNEKNQNKIS